jgi:L-aminopeptidase/D-esterase-like protein
MTNARLSKQEATRLAMMAQAGIARAVVPAYTLGDGDTVFVLAAGDQPLRSGELTSLGAMAAETVAGAITAGVRAASSVAGIPSVSGR